jgi:SAM-dependent methyltransferase
MRNRINTWINQFQQMAAKVPLGPERDCCMCGARVGRFLPYRGGWRDAPPLLRAFDVVGSDLDNYLCPLCGCHDRERHLLFYLRQGGMMEKLRGADVLHFAPEGRLTALIEKAAPARYVLADLFPTRPGIERVDLLAIPHAAGTFDFVIANHVLEHVADDLRALSEVRRVLKAGGHAILQTPYSNLLASTFCDAGVQSEQARLQIYGQEDHVRLYGRDIFERFASAGFVSRVALHAQALPTVDPIRHGVNPREPFFLFEAA